MGLDVAPVAVCLEAAAGLAWQACASWIAHPLSMVASLFTVFLILTSVRIHMADRRHLGHDVEV